MDPQTMAMTPRLWVRLEEENWSRLSWRIVISSTENVVEVGIFNVVLSELNLDGKGNALWLC